MSRLRSLLIYFLSISVLISNSAQADQTSLRKTFQKAEQQVWQANTAKYQTLYQQLHYYPLQPYLDKQRLIHGMKMSDTEEINQFLQKYKGSPLDLRRRPNNAGACTKMPFWRAFC